MNNITDRMKALKKMQAENDKKVKVYDTDKYFITRVSGALLLLTILFAIIIIIIW